MTREPPTIDPTSGRADVDDELEELGCICIHVHLLAGTEIDRACDQLVKMAKRLGTTVEANFNGVTISAHVGSVPSDLANKWRVAMFVDSIR